MATPLLPFRDITSRKHRGNPYSVAANSRCDKSSLRELVFDEILEADDGLTVREVSEILNHPMHSISGRVSELKTMRLVRGTGRSRDGGEVIVAVVAISDHAEVTVAERARMRAKGEGRG